MTYSKKINEVVKLYLTMCTEEAPFNKKGPTPSFWKLRKFFIEQKDENLIDILYDYLVSIKQPIRASLTQAIGYAKEHQSDMKWEKDKEESQKKLTVKQDAYSLDALLDL